MKKQILAICLLVSISMTNCKKTEVNELSKEELVKGISKSKEFNEFYKLSRTQSSLILSSTKNNLDQDKNLIDSEITKLQLAKKKCIESLTLLYDVNTLKSINREDLRTIVQNISLQEIEKENVSNSSSNIQIFSAESCKKQWDKEVNECFENFLIDEGSCFLQGLWGIITGCHIESVRDHLKCNRAADRHYKECK